jgi:hypothetical protein
MVNPVPEEQQAAAAENAQEQPSADVSPDQAAADAQAQAAAPEDGAVLSQ